MAIGTEQLDTARPRITRSGDLPWLGDEHGAGSKVLWVNPDAGWFTSLVKGRAGQVNPAHTHVGPACFYVLDGGFDYRGGSARAGDWVWEPSGSVHEATTHPVDTVYLAQVYGPVAFHGRDGRPPRLLDWRATQRMVDRAARGAAGPAGQAGQPDTAATGATAGAGGFDPLDAALVRTGAGRWADAGGGRQVQVLRVSPEAGHVHLLVRAEAGSVEPARVHLGPAELYVLSGSLGIDGEIASAGDHVVEPPGARRGPSSCLTDALYLLSAYGPVGYTDPSGSITRCFDWQVARALAQD